MKEQGRKAERSRALYRFLLILVLAVKGFLLPDSAHAEQAEHAGHSPRPSATRDSMRDSPLSGPGEEMAMEMTVQLSPEMLKMSGIRTAPVEYRSLVSVIQTVGEVTYDERLVKVVSAWVGGRIDRLYVDFTGVEVKKGTPLAELYSPDLVSTQREYLLALETRERMSARSNSEALAGADKLVDAARQRLSLWGISDAQITHLEKTGKVNSQMSVLAPVGGIVIHKNALEGQYLKTGEKFYTIADLSTVWVMVDIYENELAGVTPGQKVSVVSQAYPEHTFTGTVSFIDPFLDMKTRSVKVRLDIPNKQLILKPGMFVEARLHVPYKDGKPVLAIPHTAVLDTGPRKLAYIDMGEGMFKGVEIRVGPRAGEWVPVLSGLEKDQRVAVTANYLIDSQRVLGSGAGSEFGGALGHGHTGH